MADLKELRELAWCPSSLSYVRKLATSKAGPETGL